MRHSNYVYLFLVVVLGLCLASCSGRPVAQIERTEQAREQAKAEAAQEFATEDWNSAEAAYGEAQRMLEQKKWREADARLLKAMTGYQKARDIAKGRREDTIRRIQNNQKTVELRAKALQELYRSNLGKFSAARRKHLEETWKAFEEKIATMSRQLEQGRYSDAEFLAGRTLREIWELRQELEKVTGKTSF